MADLWRECGGYGGYMADNKWPLIRKELAI